MQYANRVQETTQTTGTGSLTLDGATFRYKTFASELTVAGDNFHYLLEDENGAWEIGIGYLATATSIQRQTLLESSTGALINLSTGIHRITLVFIKEDFENLNQSLIDHINDVDPHPQYTTHPEATSIAIVQAIALG